MKFVEGLIILGIKSLEAADVKLNNSESLIIVVFSLLYIK